MQDRGCTKGQESKGLNVKQAGMFRADPGRVCPLVWLEQREEIMTIKEEDNVGNIGCDPVVKDFNF